MFLNMERLEFPDELFVVIINSYKNNKYVVVFSRNAKEYDSVNCWNTLRAL